MKLISSAIELPRRCVTSAELDIQAKQIEGQTEASFLIKQRYYADPANGETADALGATALKRALAEKDLNIEDVDCLIAACATSAQAIPYNAASIYRHMGSERRIHTFDVGMTCLSFLQALDVANLYLASGRYRRIAIVSADLASVGLNHAHPESSAIFGDGAVAFIFEALTIFDLGTSRPNPEPLFFGVKSTCFETVHDAYGFCEIRAGGSSRHISRMHTEEDVEQFRQDASFKMDGKRLYRHVLKDFRPFVDRHLEGLGMTMDDVSLVIPHQASGHGLMHVQRLLGVEDERFLNVFSEYGNQVAASIPFALHLARVGGRFKAGDTLLLLGTSAGMSYGSAVLQIS
jgi:3-oxoacyl-[acyl-carrier-protein] synthase-3